jgi:hypothetical protein
MEKGSTGQAVVSVYQVIHGRWLEMQWQRKASSFNVLLFFPGSSKKCFKKGQNIYVQQTLRLTNKNIPTSFLILCQESRVIFSCLMFLKEIREIRIKEAYDDCNKNDDEFFYSFLIEFMSFFDKNDYRDLQRSSVDFSLTFFKQQIIK